ncbi:hypothetical protein PpBr36_09079 [Pyricularia pennisetigena]|uniref:hypothetical protein n=1 Tax=Pyricularia pennisetigena TaxID=1578925 RepID=UPI00114D8A3E|nr:hypothetical protein PpBr36_09079 [Pyricularia pennisetigena]TLS24892.1 hypothetical protein PpBr36_09079 [Pyricularia pennisetigena]
MAGLARSINGEQAVAVTKSAPDASGTLNSLAENALTELGISRALVEDAYACTPVQEGILLACIRQPLCRHGALLFAVIPRSELSLVPGGGSGSAFREEKKNGVTIPTLMQAAWATVLRTYTQTGDVCFEYLASGRDEPANSTAVPFAFPSEEARINGLVGVMNAMNFEEYITPPPSVNPEDFIGTAVPPPVTTAALGYPRHGLARVVVMTR